MDRQGRQRMKHSDIISNLPEDIIERILGRMPKRDSVKTSFLSRNWRYKWTTLPLDKFDGRGIYFCSTNPEKNGDQLFRVTYSALSQHKGPIHKFSLYSGGMPNMLIIVFNVS